MTSPFDLLTGGLGQASGLSLTTGGLLVISEVFGVPGQPGAPSRARIDVRLVFDPESAAADLAIEGGDLAAESSLASALMLSLFTDARATDDELARFGGDDARGWWGDSLSDVDGDEYGSKLWLLQREKQTGETLARAKTYAEQALAWLISDGIADAVNVTAVYPRRSLLGLVVEPVRARAPRERYAYVWEL